MDILRDHRTGASASEAVGQAILGSINEATLARSGDSTNHHLSSSSAVIADLVGLVYEAAVDPSRWQAFIDAYVLAVGGRRGALLLNSVPQDGKALVRLSNWPDEDFRVYAEGYILEDLHHNDGLSRPEGGIREIDLTCSAEVVRRSKAYREFYKARSVRYQLSGVFLCAADARSMIVAVREDRDGPFIEPAFSILRSLMPHLRRAGLLHGELFWLRIRLAASTVYLDRYPNPFLLTDAQGRVICANRAANEATSLKDGIAVTSGQLSMTCPRDQATFFKTLERVTARGGPALCRVEVKRPSRKSPFLLLLMPVPGLGLAQCAVAVLVVDSEARPEVDPAVLRELFWLTPAEARVTGKLGGGKSAQEIAEEMGVCLETVRTHIRRVLSKTATARQGELISLVLRAAPFRSL